MELNRREFAAAGVSLSTLLAGCADDSSANDGNSSGSDGNGSGGGGSEGDGNESEGGGSEGDENGSEGDGNESEPELDDDESAASGEANESDGSADESETEIYEDESISGEISLSEAAARHLEVERHTFTWADEPPSEFCQVHAMLANVGGAEFTATATARVFDADGNELSSTSDPGMEGPEPGVDDAVHSFELNNCADAAAYELEIGDVEADGDGVEPVERHLLGVIVQDGLGDPIDNATVSVEERGLGGWGETRTVDEHGQAEFEFQPGAYTLTATAEGYPTLEDVVELTGNMQYTATLRAND